MKNKLLKTLTPLVLVVLLIATLASVFVITAGAAETAKTYKLVTDASDLQVDDQVIIVASDSNFAMSTTQNKNNRVQASVSVNESDNTITIGTDVQVFTLEAGTTEGTFAFKTEKGYYIYAASSSKNYLRTQPTNDDNSSWTISITGGVATIKAKGTNTRNWLQYNKSRSLFSCYSGAQQGVSIYKLVQPTPGGEPGGNECQHTVVTDAAVAATCTKTGLTEGSHCSVCGTVIVAQETVEIIDHNYENGSCTMCGKTEPVIPFKVGDIVIFTGSKSDGTDTRELTGFATADAKYGTATVYTTAPEGTFLITVVEGYQSGTFAFKNGDKYITCNGEKNVNLSTTLDAKSSWTVEIEDGKLKITSCSNTIYYLQYNSKDPRFTTYTGTQQPIKVVKVVDAPSITTVGASLNTGVKIRVTYNIPEAWLTANAGAQVMFSCNGTTQLIDAVAGSYTYSVNLAPTFMSKTLNVQIVDGSGNPLTDAEDVSLKTYKDKLEEAYTNKTLEGFSDEKYDATIKLISAALKCSDVAVAKDKYEGSIDNPKFTNVEAAVKGDDSYRITVNGSLGANANLVITVTGATPASVTIGGKKVGTIEGNKITISGIYHTMFNDEIVISDGTNAIFTFSFNTYLKAIYESNDATLFEKNFAAATYLYGVAAEAYNNAK